MFKNITPAQVELLKWAAIGIVGFWAYKKISGAISAAGAAVVQTAEEVVTVKLNPMHRDNLAHTAAENIIGAEQLADGSTRFFDWVDKAAEFVGFENGINGVPGTTAELTRKNAVGGVVVQGPAKPVPLVLKDAPFIVAPEAGLQDAILRAGETITSVFGKNANG